MSGDPAPAEPWVDLGVDLLVDEPEVKCWVETVPPGEERPLHHHRYPWITVVVSGASGVSYGPNGEELSRSELRTGAVVHNGGDRLPLSHFVRNTSDRTLVMVAIELRASDPVPLALEAPCQPS